MAIHKKKRLSLGFTIVEMLLALTLFGILVPVIIDGLNSISMLNDSARDLAIANIYAENKIEELRSNGFNSVPVGTTSITSALPATLGKARTGGYMVTNNTPGLKEIVLTITITGRMSSSKTLTYKSVIGELGVGQ